MRRRKENRKLDAMVGICFKSAFCRASHKNKKLAAIPQNFLDFNIAGMVPCGGNINKIVCLPALNYDTHRFQPGSFLILEVIIDVDGFANRDLSNISDSGCFLGRKTNRSKQIF
jgi:hypothetical protein